MAARLALRLRARCLARRLCSRTSSSAPTSIPVPLQALLSAGAVRSRIAACAVVAECASVGSTAGLLSVSTRRIALCLVEIVAAAILVLYSSGGLLVQSPLTGGRLIRSGLGGSAQILAVVLRQILLIVAKLWLIVFLVEVRSGRRSTGRIVEIVSAIVAVEVISVDVVRIDVIAIYVVAVDVVGIDIVAIDVICVDVVSVVVVVAVDEGVRVRDIDIAVVGH